jgi:hypothetical protein
MNRVHDLGAVGMSALMLGCLLVCWGTGPKFVVYIDLSRLQTITVVQAGTSQCRGDCCACRMMRPALP